MASATNGLISLGVTGAKRSFAEQMLSGIRNGAKIALRAAINDTIKSARTQLTKNIGATLNVKQQDIRDRISITKQATNNDLEAKIKIDYLALPLQDFRPSVSRKSGVSATIIKGGDALKFRHGFSAEMDTGHLGVFIRNNQVPKYAPSRGKYAGRRIKRGPRKGQLILRQAIKETYGVSVVVAFDRDADLVNRSMDQIKKTFDSRLQSKIDWQLAKGSPTLPPG